MEDHTCDDRPTAHDCRHAVDRSLGESPRTVGLCNARHREDPVRDRDRERDPAGRRGREGLARDDDESGRESNDQLLTKRVLVEEHLLSLS
jgi:hypothetical protein